MALQVAAQRLAASRSRCQTVPGLRFDRVWQGHDSRVPGLQGRLAWVHDSGDLIYACSGTCTLTPELPTVEQASTISLAHNLLRGGVRMSATLGRQGLLSRDPGGTWAQDQDDWKAGLSHRFIR